MFGTIVQRHKVSRQFDGYGLKIGIGPFRLLNVV